jgi:hypothetical protein
LDDPDLADLDLADLDLADSDLADSDLANDGFLDLVAVADFAPVVAGYGLTTMDFGVVGSLASLSIQPCGPHSCKLAADGPSPKAIKIPATTPMISSPMQFPSSGAELRLQFLPRLILMLILICCSKPLSAH